MNFTGEQLDILSCFLNPDEMQRHPEAPLPADAKEEILGFVGEQARPKVRNVKGSEKFDPIHHLFYPKDEKEGKYMYIRIAQAIIVALLDFCLFWCVHSIQIHQMLSCDML